MACGFDKGLIAAHYDGETTAAERAEVERHLATCPECARDLASMKELSAALKPLARASAPMSIAEGVVREIGSSRSARRPWIGWGLSAAAAMLLAVGTVYMLDRGAAPRGTETVATAPAPKPMAKPAESRGRRDSTDLDDKTSRDEALKSLERPMGPKAAAPPPPPAPAPEPEPPAPDPIAPAKKTEDGGETRKAAPKDEKPAVPVVRVTAADVAAARGEVEAFLKERELKVTPGAPLLGRSAFVRDHYLQLELTDAEVQQLEKRLAALKETVVARGSFDDEKKRVAEDLAKQKAAGLHADAAKPAEEPAEKDAESNEFKEKADRARGAPALGGAFKRGPLRKIIFVFEPAPAKK